MRRALHIGIFIGTLIGMSACASAEVNPRAAQTAIASAQAVR